MPRAHFQITDRGRQVLAKRPATIDIKLLDSDYLEEE
jgi:hypothetical protein